MFTHFEENSHIFVSQNRIAMDKFEISRGIFFACPSLQFRERNFVFLLETVILYVLERDLGYLDTHLCASSACQCLFPSMFSLSTIQFPNRFPF